MENKNNSFWNTQSGNAAIKFGLWMIFMILLIVIFSFGENRNVSNDKIENDDKQVEEVYSFKNYEEMQEELVNSEYAYSYKVRINDTLYLFNGDKCNKADIGYKESSDGIIKYRIDDNGVYKVIIDRQEEVNLYEGIDSSFLDVKTIINNLKEYLYSVQKNANVRTITYNKEGYGVVVKTNEERITNIVITKDNEEYDLEFTKTEKCANINLTEN